MVHFWFCPQHGFENFEKLGLNFSNFNPSPSLPSATRESSKQSQCSYLVFRKQNSSLFLSFHRWEDLFQHSKAEQNRAPEIMDVILVSFSGADG